MKPAKTTEAITISESKRLIALERTIKEGQQTFIAVGNALSEIRESKLYRADYATFEDYCREKWGWNPGEALQSFETDLKVLISMIPGGIPLKPFVGVLDRQMAALHKRSLAQVQTPNRYAAYTR